MTKEFEPVTVVVPSGMLGAGIYAEQVAWGIAQGGCVVAVDAGSTDSGASCLATGKSKLSRDVVKRDIRAMMSVAVPAGVPILIGSCGTAGTDMGVDWTHEIVQEVARELGQTPRIALLYSEQDKQVLTRKIAEGATKALPPSEPLTAELVEDCAHIVALMGPEPFIAALEAGADIVLGGRTTDTAILAAVPLMRGADVAHSWHAAKTAECGGLCTVNPREGGVLFRVGRDHFTIEPLNQDNECTPASVSAHMLYENSDPFHLVEPGLVLDVSNSDYQQVDPRTVRVTGSTFQPMPYSMKLEGASSGPFQTVMIVGISDPTVLAEMDLLLSKMNARMSAVVAETFPDVTDWDLSLRPYGWNAVSGLPVPEGYVPNEVGLMLVVTAPTQDLATRIAKGLNAIFFHFPIRRGIPLPTYGFPFSPAEMERGQVHEFRLNHIVETTDPMELVRMELLNMAQENAA